MKILASFWLTVLIVLALLGWLWATRSTVQPSLIMSLETYLAAEKAAARPSFCMWDYPGSRCRVS